MLKKLIRSFMIKKKILNNKGSALIGFVLLASIGSAYYISNVSGLIKDISKQKSKSEYDYYTTSLSHGLFNYTINAIKERWCMNSNWGRDVSCNGPLMKDIVLNKYNLERFLWSKATVADIEQRYKTKYGVNIPEPASLFLLEHTVTLENLESLGLSHPLNLILNNKKLKSCLESVTIKIEKPQASQYVPLGDETSLMITITKKLKSTILGNCDYLNRKKVLQGLALFFPRTLNQFSLIKAGDLDLTQFFSANTQPGITFHGPVYLENNLIMANTGYSSVTFKDVLRLGGGSLKYKNENLYSPKSAGLHKDMLQSHYENFGGLFGGVGLEGEVDEGISALYGGSYAYPSGSIIAGCANRKNLKDNPSLTKNSRLMIMSTGADKYDIALTLDNEFRESEKEGEENGFYVRNIKANENNLHDRIQKKLTVNFTQRSTSDRPVLAITSHLDHPDEGESNTRPASMGSNNRFFNKTLLGRNNIVELQLADTDFLQEQLDALDPDADGVIDIDKFSQNEMGTDSKITDVETTYDNLKDVCKDLKDEDWWLPQCNIAYKEHGQNPQLDCQDLLETKSSAPDPIPAPEVPADPNDIDVNPFDDYYKSNSRDKYRDCANMQADALGKFTAYLNAENIFKSELNDFKDNPPKIEITTTDKLSNKVGLEFKVINDSKLNSIFSNNIQKVYMRLTAFDFMVEGANDLDRGKRNSWGHLPGPNETDGNNLGQPNTIYFDTASKTFRYLDNNQVLTNRINNNKNADNPDGWSILKEEDSGGSWYNNPEPPLNIVNGNEVAIIPNNGLTTLEAKDNDDLCNQDVDPLAFTEWDISFTDTTQFSWLYNVTAPGITVADPSIVEKRPSFEFPKENVSEMTPGSRLPSYSIVKDCIVNSDVDFVLGLFACDNFIIKPRTSKLDIVGTFVVKNLNIDSSALGAGVNFYSLWNTKAIKMLEDKKWLERESNSAGSKACSSITVPGWAKNLSANMTLDFNSCSPMKFIYSGANNFNWTTVDPEIGIDPSGNSTTTQSKVVNRYRRYKTSVVWRREYDSI